MAAEFPKSYKDPLYASLDAKTEQKLGLPVGLLSSIRTLGEKSNADQVSEASAKTPYQFIPSTAKAIIKKYGIDPLLSPENASEAAGLLLKENLERNKGDVAAAVGEYHAGPNRDIWGPRTKAYINRVMVGQQSSKVDALDNGFAKFMAANPAVPAGRAAGADAPKPEAPVDAKTDSLSAGFGQWLAQKEAPQGADAIPGQEPSVAPAPDGSVPAAGPDPTIGDRLLGAGEAALNIGTGLTGGAVGTIAGAAQGVAGAIGDGTFGTPQGVREIEQSAARGAQALTFAPRTPQGQAQAGAVGEALAQTIPVMPLAGELASAGRAAAALKPTAQAVPAIARNTAGAAAANVAQGVRAIPERVGQMVGREAAPAVPTPGTMGSVGAAGTDMALQRQVAAQSLPVPIDMTRGQLTRNPDQLRFEIETSKGAGSPGATLREFAAEQNARIPRNFDAMIDQTGATAPTGLETGRIVNQALVKDAAARKAEYKVKYEQAKKAGETLEPVSTDAVVKAINDAASAESTAPVITAARKEIQRLGGAAVDDTGSLVGGTLTLGDMEQLRKFVNKTTGFDPTNQKFAIDLKAAIDGATEGLGGDLYKGARKARQRYAQLYEDNAIVADLLATRKGTADRKVALEDVFNRTMLNGSREDLSMLRRTLQVAKSEDGQQAWKELQGATLRHIADEATKGVGTDIRGNPIVSPAKLNNAVRGLDADGKLDFILGKQRAQQVRDINEISKAIFTAPPGTVNTSNTASVLLAALAESGLSGSLTGIPLPVLTGLKALSSHVKDRRIQARVNEAIGAAKRKEAAKPRPIPMKKTIH